MVALARTAERTHSARSRVARMTRGAAVLLLIPPAAAHAGRIYDTWTSWPTPPNPSSAAVADFNHDGLPDVAVSCVLGNAVRVYLGASDGELGSPLDYATGAAPRVVLTDDVDGDGDSDLLVCAGSATGLDIFLNDGTGGFSTPVFYPTAANADAMVLTDLDGDGDRDVVIACLSTSTVNVLLSHGDGTFGPPAGYAAGTPLSLTAGDVDGDGHADIVVADGASGGALWLRGDGVGAFAAPVVVSSGEDPRAVAVLDVDGDGDLDIVVGDALSSGTDVWRNSGTPTPSFSGPEQTPLASTPVALVVAQVTPSATPEVLACLDFSNGLSVLELDGGGLLNERVTNITTVGPRGVAVGDADGDGDLDAYVAGSRSDAVALMLNDGTGRFPGGTLVGTGLAPTDATLYDVDGDGDLDAIIANQGGGSISVILNDAGTFNSSVEYPAGVTPTSLVLGDWNADGHADLAVADQFGNAVRLLSGDGTGVFAPPVTLSVPGSGPSSLALQDLNGDGRPDLAVTEFGSDDVAILLQDGLGGFTLAGTVPVGHNPSSVAFSDFDGDLVSDLAVACDGANAVWIVRGLGGGAFAPGTAYGVIGGSAVLALDDVDADGDQDVIVTNDLANTVTVLRDAGGVLTTSQVLPSARNPLDVQVADVTLDGIPDLIVANVLGDVISIYPGYIGGFAAARQYGTGTGAGYIAVGDVDGDFDQDLFVTGDPTAGVDAAVLANKVDVPTAAHVLMPVASVVAASRSIAVTWPCAAVSPGPATVVRRALDGDRGVAVLGAAHAVSGGCGVIDATVAAGVTYRYEVWSRFGAADATLLGATVARATWTGTASAARLVWPNPSRGTLHCALPGGARVAEVRVFDVNGREQLRRPAVAGDGGVAVIEARRADGQALPAGVYVIEMRAAGKATRRERIMLMR